MDYPAPVTPINNTLCCVLILPGYSPLWSASEILTHFVSRRILEHQDVCSWADAKFCQKMLVMVTFHSYAYIKRTIHNKYTGPVINNMNFNNVQATRRIYTLVSTKCVLCPIVWGFTASFLPKNKPILAPLPYILALDWKICWQQASKQADK